MCKQRSDHEIANNNSDISFKSRSNQIEIKCETN